MGTGASSGGSQAGSSANVKEGSTPIEPESRSSRKTSSISKKHSNGFITLSYEPTHTPLIRKRGCIKEGFPVHGLIQDKYFLIKDHFDGIDKLKTLDTHGAPNFRKSRGPYPVYGMGQPSRDGLAHVIQTLVENGHKVRRLQRFISKSAYIDFPFNNVFCFVSFLILFSFRKSAACLRFPLCF